MKTVLCQNVNVWITSSLSTVLTPTDIALGNFDGVHLGHQTVIRSILPDSEAKAIPGVGQWLTEAMGQSAFQGYSDRASRLLSTVASRLVGQDEEAARGTVIPSVVTFYPHPREFFSGVSRPWLTPLVEKAAFFGQMGIRQLVLLPFTQELADLSPQAFVEEILLDRLQARRISVGADFKFGHNRAGNVSQLADMASQRGTQVTVVDLAQNTGDRISSSRIRHALGAGDMTQVHDLLGRAYSLTGRVVRGQQLGRQLGFPTANLAVPPEKFLPRTGVYSVWVYGVPGQRDHQGLPGVMNLGVRPTVDGQTQTVEVHLLDWQGDLYDRTITITLKAFLRPEQQFASLDQLKAQIQTDCHIAQATLLVGNSALSRA